MMIDATEESYGFSSELFVGHKFKDIQIRHEEVIFTRSDGIIIVLYHIQDCCEYVSVDEWDGDVQDLIKTPITRAEERTNHETDTGESVTWTFYNFQSSTGYIHLTFRGESNGYYSESVDCKIIKPQKWQVHINIH